MVVAAARVAEEPPVDRPSRRNEGTDEATIEIVPESNKHSGIVHTQVARCWLALGSWMTPLHRKNRFSILNLLLLF